MSDWLQLANVTLHSGRRSSFKIECDELTADVVAAGCALLAKVLPPFGAVSGVPTGGLRLEEAMQPHITDGPGPMLIIDDVWTTGGSMRRHHSDHFGGRHDGGCNCLFAVLFARGAYPVTVTALFTLDARLWSA